MKMNKKLMVPFLATVVGLSISGGLGGAFAWYQFNSQVRTSFIGTSVMDTGVLQIGYETTPGDSSTMKWGNMHTKNPINFVPVTFGQLGENNTLPAKAWGYPDAGKQLDNNYNSGWTEMKNGTHYYQYDIYLRALKKDSSNTTGANGIPVGFGLAAVDVYLSSMTLQDAAAAHANDDTYVANALRVHLNAEGVTKKLLISKNEIDEDHALPLNGEMCLSGEVDGDGNPVMDKYFVPYGDAKYGQTCKYGVENDKQVTTGIDDIVNPRNNGVLTPDADKVIVNTSTNSAPAVKKITVTVWLEGWALLRTAEGSSPALSNVWNPNLSTSPRINVDMVFDAAVLG